MDNDREIDLLPGERQRRIKAEQEGAALAAVGTKGVIPLTTVVVLRGYIGIAVTIEYLYCCQLSAERDQLFLRLEDEGIASSTCHCDLGLFGDTDKLNI